MAEINAVPKWGEILSATFLVAGTCIGGGMLALPVATGLTGYIPAIVVMFVAWVMMTATGLLLMEASLWLPEGAHVISISYRFLGTYGRAISWLLFLFISYASLVAYAAGGGVQMGQFFSYITGSEVSKIWGIFLFILLFCFVVWLGHLALGRINSILFIAMCTSYVAIVGGGFIEVDPSLLMRLQWKTALIPLPLLLTSFSFQTLVPSLNPLLQRHAPSLRKAIIGGTSLAFLIYLIWLTLVMGIVPAEGELGLIEALVKGQPATESLRHHVESRFLWLAAEFFAYFALITSFLGIALGLFDFLSDGLKIAEKGGGRLFLVFLIAVPTYIFAVNWERAFLVALDATGGVGDTFLNGLIPVMVVWIGRYYAKMQGEHAIPGGRFSLSAIFLFYLLTIGLVVLMQLGYATSIANISELL